MGEDDTFVHFFDEYSCQNGVGSATILGSLEGFFWFEKEEYIGSTDHDSSELMAFIQVGLMKG